MVCHMYFTSLFGGKRVGGFMGVLTLLSGHHVCKKYSCTKSRITFKWPGIVLKRVNTNMIFHLNHPS